MWNLKTQNTQAISQDTGQRGGCSGRWAGDGGRTVQTARKKRETNAGMASAACGCVSIDGCYWNLKPSHYFALVGILWPQYNYSKIYEFIDFF